MVFFSFKTLICFARRQFVKMILISVRSIGVDTVSNGQRVVIFSEGLELLSQSVLALFYRCKKTISALHDKGQIKELKSISVSLGENSSRNHGDQVSLKNKEARQMFSGKRQ